MCGVLIFNFVSHHFPFSYLPHRFNALCRHHVAAVKRVLNETVTHISNPTKRHNTEQKEEGRIQIYKQRKEIIH
ncbi:hypothetical protein VNO77_05674 [Canavalia gladiata]|uniref:Uncharacterized protein n=1 Tax=Canavalia gladiata TaxID=3824 RepID=A0AAN9RED0_CANGL